MTDPAVLFVALFALAVIMLAVISKWQLLQTPTYTSYEGARLPLMSLLIGFLIFVFTCGFIPLWVGKVIHYADTHGYSSFSVSESDNFGQLLAILIALFLLMGFSRIHPEPIRERIWGANGYLKAFLKGILYCLIAYPIVMTVVQGIHLAVDWFGVKPVYEQVALAQLKAIQSYPWLFWSFVVAIVFVVPLVEEFLFRGLLQNFLGNFAGPQISILVTSLFFAAFHYSPLQGSTNIELMIGLFMYSYFIGLFYIRERSLWTPIAMHATFNALTIFVMFYLIK